MDAVTGEWAPMDATVSGWFQMNASAGGWEPVDTADGGWAPLELANETRSFTGGGRCCLTMVMEQMQFLLLILVPQHVVLLYLIVEKGQIFCVNIKAQIWIHRLWWNCCSEHSARALLMNNRGNMVDTSCNIINKFCGILINMLWTELILIISGRMVCFHQKLLLLVIIVIVVHWKFLM